MIPAETQRQSWTETQADLGTRRRDVLDLFFERKDGWTAWEVAERLERPVYVVRPRISELSKLGLLVPVGKKRSRFTGKLEALWRSSSYVNEATLL